MSTFYWHYHHTIRTQLRVYPLLEHYRRLSGLWLTLRQTIHLWYFFSHETTSLLIYNAFVLSWTMLLGIYLIVPDLNVSVRLLPCRSNVYLCAPILMFPLSFCLYFWTDRSWSYSEFISVYSFLLKSIFFMGYWSLFLIGVCYYGFFFFISLILDLLFFFPPIFWPSFDTTVSFCSAASWAGKVHFRHCATLVLIHFFFLSSSALFSIHISYPFSQFLLRLCFYALCSLISWSSVLSSPTETAEFLFPYFLMPSFACLCWFLIP